MTLKFLVTAEEAGADGPSLDHAYLMGSDQHAIRADISFESGVIVCSKRESGVAHGHGAGSRWISQVGGF